VYAEPVRGLMVRSHFDKECDWTYGSAALRAAPLARICREEEGGHADPDPPPSAESPDMDGSPGESPTGRVNSGQTPFT
jgi:hypothetical protein